MSHLLYRRLKFVALFVCPFIVFGEVRAQEGAPADAGFEDAVTPLLESSCYYCHEDESETGLDITALDFDLTEDELFSKWERIFDRIEDGEMPPATEGRPDDEELQTALDALRDGLTRASRQRQVEEGRVPARRLTKLEFGNTLRDLLLIDGDVESVLPDEMESGSFDTVGSSQRISAVHLESYLTAADMALEQAIHLERFRLRRRETDYSWLREWHDKPLDLGGNVTRELERGIALFVDTDYLTGFQFEVRSPGIHRLTFEVAGYQSEEPVTMKLILKHPGGGATLLKVKDLDSGEPETIEVETWMDPGWIRGIPPI